MLCLKKLFVRNRFHLIKTTANQSLTRNKNAHLPVFNPPLKPFIPLCFVSRLLRREGNRRNSNQNHRSSDLDTPISRVHLGILRCFCRDIYSDYRRIDYLLRKPSILLLRPESGLSRRMTNQRDGRLGRLDFACGKEAFKTGKKGNLMEKEIDIFIKIG